MESVSIVVEKSAEFENVLHMIWSAVPDADAVTNAFAVIQQHLSERTSQMCIIVDIQANPVFPLRVTIDLAMNTTKHQQLGKWLVIGANRNAKFIGKMVMAFGKNNVLWFDNEDAVSDYLRACATA